MRQSNNHQEKAYFFQHADPIIGKHVEMQRGRLVPSAQMHPDG